MKAHTVVRLQGSHIFSRQSAHRWPPSTSQEDSWYSFLLEAEWTSGPVWLEGLGKQLETAVTFWLVV
jgi:hypothetical protein